jgi:glycosyltransferase involved in cell wall biosynthesis
MKVSVIVPIYYGKKYIVSILQQIEENVDNLIDVGVELIIYNDSPEQKICIYNRGIYNFDIKVIQPQYNSGIHGARVRGLQYATGDYIVYLDQDDQISSEYLRSQVSCVLKNDADAAVCRAMENDKCHYNKTLIFEKAISKEFLLNKFNPIISPGQVIIKRSSIPIVWLENILKYNGADDYMLWLAMFGMKKKFALNQDILFEHIVTGLNTSDDVNQMMDSEQEMIDILSDNEIFIGNDYESLMQLKNVLRRMHIKQLEKYRETLGFIKEWNYRIKQTDSLGMDWLNGSVQKVSIYGAGILGQSIKDLLEEIGIEVVYYLDINAEYMKRDIPVYDMNMEVDDVDLVVLTIKQSQIKRDLEKKFQSRVLYAEDLLAT